MCSYIEYLNFEYYFSVLFYLSNGFSPYLQTDAALFDIHETSGLGVGINQRTPNILARHIRSWEPHLDCHIIAHVLVIVHVEGPHEFLALIHRDGLSNLCEFSCMETQKKRSAQSRRLCVLKRKNISLKTEKLFRFSSVLSLPEMIFEGAR